VHVFGQQDVKLMTSLRSSQEHGVRFAAAESFIKNASSVSWFSPVHRETICLNLRAVPPDEDRAGCAVDVVDS